MGLAHSNFVRVTLAGAMRASIEILTNLATLVSCIRPPHAAAHLQRPHQSLSRRSDPNAAAVKYSRLLFRYRPGPAAKIRTRARRSSIGHRNLTYAPPVPERPSCGTKYGNEASTPCRRATTKCPKAWPPTPNSTNMAKTSACQTENELSVLMKTVPATNAVAMERKRSPPGASLRTSNRRKPRLTNPPDGICCCIRFLSSMMTPNGCE